MLEPMKRAAASRDRGFTMVEMMVALLIAGVILTLVIPSFSSFLNKRKVDGAMAELSTDLQFARTEAVSRNTPVRITFGSNCYVVHLSSAAATCASPGSGSIKTVQLATGNVVTMAAANSLTFIEYRAQLGNATWNGSNATTATVNVVDSADAVPLRLNVISVGRGQVCSPGGKNRGYVAC
jgi:type IV fimbrial biogenesis protein FimT